MEQGTRADYIDSRQFGAATVTVVSEGTARWAPHFGVPEAVWRPALPEADAAGRIPIGLTVVLVRLGDATVLVDPGFDDPAAPAGYVTPKLEDVRRSPGLGAALATLGIAPEAITHVVLTHAHPDHCCGVAAERDGQLVARYPNARHIIGAADWAAVRAQPADSPLAARLGVIERLGRLETVASEHALAPGITLLPSPGETPGHLALRIESAGARCYSVGDLFHHGCEVAHLDWAPPGRDVAANQASRARVLAEAAASQAALIFTHAVFPPWGRVVRAGAGYRWVAG